MARIPIEKGLRWVLDRAPGLTVGECLDLLCKKKNRLLRITKMEHGFRIEERGFLKEDHLAEDIQELKKLLPRLLVREFPRSHMLWVFKRRA